MKFPFHVAGGRKFDCLGFGTNAVDYLIEVPEYPAFNSKTELVRYTQAAGGEVATTMVGLQRMGLDTAYAGRFGDDPAGDFGIESLSAEGVDVEYAEQIAGAFTQIAFIIIDAQSGERTVIWKRDAKLSYSETDAPVHLAFQAPVLHMTPHDVEASIAMAQAARSANAVVSLDIDRVFDGVDRLLPLVDVLIASAEFPQRLFGISDHGAALAEMASRFGCGVTGVTLGAAGSLLYSAGGLIRSSGYSVPGGCRDTTGAGDAFRVGIIYGLVNGLEIDESARIANAVAALKCRSVGARTALPDRDGLFQFLASQ